MKRDHSFFILALLCILVGNQARHDKAVVAQIVASAAAIFCIGKGIGHSFYSDE
jgi:hypothetical protein